MKNVCFLKVNRDLMFRIIDDGESLLEISRAQVPTPCMCSAVTSKIGSEAKDLIEKCIEKEEPAEKDVLERHMKDREWFTDKTKIL